MSKKMIAIHHTLFFMSILILTASLIFYLIKWNSLPEDIGIHFAPNGQFDVVASKFYGFYPHVVGGILIAGFAVVDDLTDKKKTGLRISSEGEMVFKTEFRLTLDSISVLLSLFFANWSRSVSLQVPLDVDLIANLGTIMLVISAAGIIAGIITYQKYKE